MSLNLHHQQQQQQPAGKREQRLTAGSKTRGHRKQQRRRPPPFSFLRAFCRFEIATLLSRHVISLFSHERTGHDGTMGPLARQHLSLSLSLRANLIISLSRFFNFLFWFWIIVVDTSWFLWNEKESYGLIDFSLIDSLFIRTRWVYINLFLELLMKEVPRNSSISKG